VPPPAPPPPPPNATLTVANDSSFVIEELRVADVDSVDWGPNLIPNAMLPGEQVVIVDIECSEYDVYVRDETGVDCVLGNLRLCFDDNTWHLDNATLDRCAFGKR
jgi:hypothetical protein